MTFLPFTLAMIYSSLLYFFLLAIVFLGPLRVRALVLLRWPRTGSATTVAHAAIAADFSQALDIQRGLTTQITLDDVAVVNGLTELGLIGLRQILDAGVGVDACLCQDVLSTLSSNTIDISQTDFDSAYPWAGQYRQYVP